MEHVQVSDPMHRFGDKLVRQGLPPDLPRKDGALMVEGQKVTRPKKLRQSYDYEVTVLEAPPTLFPTLGMLSIT